MTSDFEHLNQLPLTLLVTTGRTGSDFFQSLVDGHPQVLSIPGNWNYVEFWNKAICKNDVHLLIDEFIWFHGPTPHIYKFISMYHTQERLDKMGESQNESFVVNIEKFRENCRQLMQGLPITARNFFVAVHGAYDLARGNALAKRRLIFYHIHHINYLEQFRELVGDFKVLCTIRDPRNTLVSGMEHWKAYDPSTFNFPHYRFALKRQFIESSQIRGMCKTVKLEDVHLQTQNVMRDFCDWNGLEMDCCFEKSTFNGLLWWGDLMSPQPQNGFNKNIDRAKWMGKLNWIDGLIFETLLEPRFKHYGYRIQSAIPSPFRMVLAALLIPFLTRYEKRIFVFQWMQNSSISGRMGVCFQFVKSYLLRISFFYKQLYFRLRGKLKLSEFLAQPFKKTLEASWN